ncbi:MAG: LacI family DNA-binding transcriptional regulator [Nocardioides sp.]|uniref:LacI family DNA-binding transcriptional regulator n=1 Tax=Nocardioides sp. TaxID=35761 RepID=UPI0039E44500
MSAHRKATLSDVASRAGVSTTTASYILNNRSAQMRISADADERVRRAAAELSYRPNRSAQSLRTRRSGTIGLISDSVASGQYGSRMLTGASAAARALDHLVVIGETEGDPVLAAQLIEEMTDRQVDGFIYATLVTSEVIIPEGLRETRSVLLNCVDRERTLPAVLPDEVAGGRTAAEVVLGAGHTTDVYVIGHDPNPHALAGPLRMEGVTARLAEAGVEVAGVVPTGWSVLPAYEAVLSWLRSGVRPEAVICLNDRIALGAYEALADHGLAVPGEVTVVSFDGSTLASWLRPSLTSVSLPYVELGAAAVRMLMDPATPSDAIERLKMPLLAGDSVRPIAR